ncbi:TPA: hypothetical protein I8672_003336 [Legionella pneumophila]|nr:hypothetical protein [Legionella pneumophila]
MCSINYDKKSINISDEQFQILHDITIWQKPASSHLLNYIYLVQNYVCFETTIFNSSLSFQLRRNCYPEPFTQDLIKINLSIINFFSTAKAFIDKGISLTAKIDKTISFNDKLSIEYDNKFSYRLLDKLRNFSQHNDNALDSLVYSQNTENEKHKFNVTPKINTETLKNHKKFETKHILPDQGLDINLVFSIREYMECLSRAHSSAVSLIEKKMKDVFKILKAYDIGIKKFILKHDNTEVEIKIQINHLLELNEQYKGLNFISKSVADSFVTEEDIAKIKSLDQTWSSSEKKFI